MTQEQIKQHFQKSLPSITDEQSREMLDSIIDLLGELRDESIDELPTMKKSLNDSFHMVITLIEDKCIF